MSFSNPTVGKATTNATRNNDSARGRFLQAERNSMSPEECKNFADNEVEPTNVGALVAKSKKVAASLFTLLHAKNCRLGVNRCSHPGCADAKLIHLHLKTCSPQGTECPSNRKGCADARKLLAHYRRCRDIRARQTAGHPRVQQHVCLVCSLVARYAKGACDLDRSVSPRTRSGAKHTGSSVGLGGSGNLRMQTQPKLCAAIRRRSATPPRGTESFSIDRTVSNGLFANDGLSTPKKMPPPPPRFPFSGVNKKTEAAQSLLQLSLTGPSFETTANDAVDPAGDELLGKSLGTVNEFTRPRAESLDLRRQNCVYHRVDITVESAMDGLNTGPEEELGEFGELDRKPKQQIRRRSMSCSVPSSSSSHLAGCETIFEETIDGELKTILDRE